MKTLSFTPLVAVLVGSAMLPPLALAANKDAADAVQSATRGKLKLGQGRVKDQECGQQIEYETQAIDLNGDGQLEVMTKEYGACFGMAGVQMNLYIKDKAGQWQPQFGFPGEPNLLTAKKHGFPDIEVLGPGQCFPVWRYNGTAYQLHKRCP